MDELVTVKQAAELLGLSYSRVRVLIESGRLKAERLADMWVLRREDVETFKALPRRVGRPQKAPEGGDR
jgi:excisionase family DNA binding protein